MLIGNRAVVSCTLWNRLFPNLFLSNTNHPGGPQIHWKQVPREPFSDYSVLRTRGSEEATAGGGVEVGGSQIGVG